MLSPKIVEQLKKQDIEVIRGPLKTDDAVHLARATEMGRVVCTEDRDFLRLSSQGIAHAGIIWGEQDKYSIGDWIRFLRFVHALSNADEMRNKVTHLFRVE